MYAIHNMCIATNWAVHVMKASNACIVLRSRHKNGLQVCVCVGFGALEVCITQIIVFHFDASCWVVSFRLCFGEACFLHLLGDLLRFREILKWLDGGNGAVMCEGYEDCVSHLKCQCYGGLTACVFTLDGTAYQKTALSHSILIVVIHFVVCSDGNDLSFKYNQQDATLYNILYCCRSSTCFRRFFHPSSGAQTVHTASGICQACLLLPLTWVSWHSVPTNPRSWLWAEKTSETCRASTAIKSIV
jgi:hypothetical protein